MQLSKLKIIEEDAQEKLGKARSLKEAGSYQLALEMYHKVLFIRESVEALVEMGEIYEAIMDVSTAVLFYKRSLQLLPRPDIKQKFKQLILVRGLEMLSIGSAKNILIDTEFPVFINRYSNFQKKLLMRTRAAQDSTDHEQLISAMAYLEVNHRKLAMDCLDDCLVVNDKDADVLVLKGFLNWSLMENRLGYQCFWKAKQCDSKHEEVVAFMQMIEPIVEELYRKAKYELISKQTTKCRLTVKQALEMHPQHPRFLILSSYLYRAKQEYQEALSELELANKVLEYYADISLENEVRNQISLTYNEMGVYLFKHNRYEEAVKLFTEGLSFKPRDWGILSNRGDCYKALNNFVNALDDYQAAYQIEPKNQQLNMKLASIHNMRGISLFNSKNMEHALKEFNEGLRLCPRFASFYVSKAKCLAQLGLKAEAIDTLNEYAAKDSKNNEVNEMLAILKQNEERRGKNGRKVIVLNKQK